MKTFSGRTPPVTVDTDDLDENFAFGYIEVTGATHTVTASQRDIVANRAGTVTLTLPTASSFTGRQLWIRTIQAQTVVSASSNVVPRAGGSAGTAILAATDGAWALIASDGTNWQIMASS
jgi:hypothetical protein